MKVNINLKFFFYISFIFFVLFFVSSILYLDRYENGLEDKLVSQGRIIVRLSNLVLVDDIVHYNDISLLSHIEKIESLDNVLYAMILSAKGVVLGHSDVYEIGNVYKDKLSQWAISVKEFTYKNYLDNGKEILVFAAPIVDKELGEVAFIRFGLSKNMIFETLKQQKKVILIFCIIFYSLFSVVFFALFYAEVSKPLNMIKDGIKLMKDNLSNFKFKIKQKDEIGEIYKNINDFVDQISGIMKESETHKDKILSLEEKRLEKIIANLKEDADILIANNENKVVFSKVTFADFVKEDCSNIHIMDALKNQELVGILTEAYSDKTDFVKQEITLGLSKYNVNIFLLKHEGPFANKTIILINKI